MIAQSGVDHICVERTTDITDFHWYPTCGLALHTPYMHDVNDHPWFLFLVVWSWSGDAALMTSQSPVKIQCIQFCEQEIFESMALQVFF